RQMLRTWRRRAREGAVQKKGGSGGGVPAGHVAVYVGAERVRYVVSTAQLHHAIFRALLGRSQQEFGFEQAGPLCIPCEAVFFEHLLSLLDSTSPSPLPSPSSTPLDDQLQDLLDFYYSSFPASASPALNGSPAHQLLPSPALAHPASA
ncbi:hypothetical protein GOP47_0003561, partial [Adiantum capillus-veneris]